MPQARQTKASETDLSQAVSKLQDFAALHDINLSFSVHKASGRTVIRVIDATTEKVVRQIPPEEILELMVYMEELAGHLLNKQA